MMAAPRFKFYNRCVVLHGVRVLVGACSRCVQEPRCVCVSTPRTEQYPSAERFKNVWGILQSVCISPQLKHPKNSRKILVQFAFLMARSATEKSKLVQTS